VVEYSLDLGKVPLPSTLTFLEPFAVSLTDEVWGYGMGIRPAGGERPETESDPWTAVLSDKTQDIVGQLRELES